MPVPTVPTIYAVAGTVLTIDPVTKSITHTLSGFGSPFSIEPFPDSVQVWVSQNSASQHVIAVDTASNTSLGAITSTDFNSLDLCFSPDSSTGYILSVSGTTWTVQSIDTTTLLQTATLSGSGGSTGRLSSRITISPDGTTLYVSVNTGTTCVVVIDAATLTVITSIPNLTGGFGLATGLQCNHAGTILYASTTKSSPNAGAYVYIIDMATNTITGTIDCRTGFTNGIAYQIAISTDDSFGYVITSGPSNTEPNLLKLDLSTNTVIGAVTGHTFTDLAGLVLTPDMTTVFVCDNGASKIHYCDTASNSFTGSVTGTTTSPIGICITNPPPAFQIVMVI